MIELVSYDQPIYIIKLHWSRVRNTNSWQLLYIPTIKPQSTCPKHKAFGYKTKITELKKKRFQMQLVKNLRYWRNEYSPNLFSFSRKDEYEPFCRKERKHHIICLIHTHKYMCSRFVANNRRKVWICLSAKQILLSRIRRKINKELYSISTLVQVAYVH